MLYRRDHADSMRHANTSILFVIRNLIVLISSADWDTLLRLVKTTIVIMIGIIIIAIMIGIIIITIIIMIGIIMVVIIMIGVIIIVKGLMDLREYVIFMRREAASMVTPVSSPIRIHD